MSDDVIDFDGDQVSLSARGKTVTVYASDEIDKVIAKIKAADEAEPLPPTVDENGLDQPGTHGSGQEFLQLLRDHFLTEHDLDVKPGVAFAIWSALVRKSEEYRDSFVCGRNSQQPSVSVPTVSSADEKLKKLLSSTPEGLEPRNDSMNSTTELANQRNGNVA